MQQKVIGICGGRSCCRNNKKLWDAAKSCEAVDVVVEEAMCLGLCEEGPNIRVDEDGVRRKEMKVTEERMEALLGS